VVGEAGQNWEIIDDVMVVIAPVVKKIEDDIIMKKQIVEQWLASLIT
jgi:hypothetical protein